jgi:hypothetical protein
MVPSTLQQEDKPDVRIHRIQRGVHTRSLLFLILSLSGALVSVGVLVWQWRKAILSFGPAALFRWISLPALATLVFLILVILAFISYNRTRHGEIQVSNAGLIINRGKKRETINWGQVIQIRTNIVRYGFLDMSWARKTEIHLVTEDASEHKIDQAFENLDELIEVIKKMVYPRLMGEYLSGFNRGEPISFGQLVLTSDGLLFRRKAMRWRDMGTAKVEKGYLQLNSLGGRKGPRLSIPAHKIPNVDLCVEIISQLSSHS